MVFTMFCNPAQFCQITKKFMRDREFRLHTHQLWMKYHAALNVAVHCPKNRPFSIYLHT